MAISFTRPDPSSPSAVASAAFTTSRKGFEQAEVREFLRMVAAELARLQEREKFLERELRTTQRGSAGASIALDEEVVTRMLGEEAARILTAAREAAAQIKNRAEDGSSRLLREATDEAQRLRTEAEIEAARRRNDAASDAESELEMAKQQGREMVNEARSYRERVLSELARRRELARQQIEQLIHGRDRLLQAFERSRAVAVDVMAELTPLAEPTEFIDLSPTTGPVPIIVPHRPLHATPTRSDVTVPMARDETGDAGDPIVEPEPVHLDLVSDAEVSGAVVVEITRPVDEDEIPAGAQVAIDGDGEGDRGQEGDGGEGGDVASVTHLFAAADDEPYVDDAAADAPDEHTALELSVEHDVTEPTPHGSVDDLFARLRASRAENVVQRVVEGAPATPLTVEDHTQGSHEVGEQPIDASGGADVAVQPSDATAESSRPDDSVFLATPDAPADVAAVDDTPFARRDAALTPVIVAAARKLKRVLADEQNEVLHALRRREPVRAVDAVLPAETDHVARYVMSIDAELVEAAVAGAQSMGATAAAAKRAVKKGAATRDAAATLGSELVMPLRDRLARSVGDADGDNAELANLVRVLYREWKSQRIDEHLDDVVRNAFGQGALSAAGDGQRIRWIVDPNGPACPDAEDNALAGPVVVGERFPTDHLCAPAHGGCTCMIAPVPD